MSYFAFFLTAISYIGLAILTASKPSLLGENAMGYGLALAFWGLCFTVSSLALTITMLVRSNFQWVANDSGSRTAIVMLSWLFILLTTFFCAIFKWEWARDANPYPQFLHWLAVNHGQIWIPLLWLAACFLSINVGLRGSVSPNVVKISFYAGLLISSSYSIGLAVGYLRDSARSYEAQVASQRQQDAYWHNEVMKDIIAHKPTDPLVNLLAQTTQVRPEDTRQAAVAKVKTYPNWEAELLELLKDKRAYREVYYFLDGNAVSHPEQFAGPLNQSIVWLAETIKADITNSNNLQHWSFDSYQIDNMLRAIDEQLLNKGVDFYPNVVKLKQALQTPPPQRFKDVRFTTTDVVDSWLKKQKHH